MSEEWDKHIQQEYERACKDPRSAAELVSQALAADEDEAWRAVSILHWRGSFEALEEARKLSASECPRERVLGADILGQLGVPKRTYPRECLSALLPLLEHKGDEDVLYSACVALGHLKRQEAVEPVSCLKGHSSDKVRLGVVFGLLGLDDRRAIQTLIELSADEDAAVRDWATFGLGTDLDTDTEAIREALARRLTDADAVTRGEAIVGLAKRGDMRVVSPLLRELSSDEVADHAVEAAGLIGDPRLYPVLIHLRERWGEGNVLLEDAINRCKC